MSERTMGCSRNLSALIAYDIPALEPHGLALYAAEHGQHRLRRVQRHRRKPAHIKVELLIEELEQGAVHPEVVGVDLEGVGGRGDSLARYGRGIEEEGSVLVLGHVLLRPAEETDGEIEGERARLLAYGTLLSEQPEQHALVLPEVVDGVHPPVLVLVEYVVRERFEEGGAVKSARQRFQPRHILARFGLHGERAHLRHALHEIFEGGDEQFDRRARHLEVEQRVAHVHVEQTALPLRDAADLLFADYVPAVFAELTGSGVRVVVLALPEVVAVLAAHPLWEGIDMHYARALDVHDEIHRGVLFEGRLRALFRLFEGDPVYEVVGHDKAYVAHPALGLAADEIGVVVDEIGKAFPDQETARVPLPAYERDERVLPVGFRHGGEQQSELEGRRHLGREYLAVIGEHDRALVLAAARGCETLIGEHAVTRREEIADIVPRARVTLAGGEIPGLQFAPREVDQLVDLRRPPHERRKAGGIVHIVAGVEGEQLHGKALLGDGRAVLVRDFEDEFALGRLVQPDEEEGRELDIRVQFSRGLAGQMDVRHLARQQKRGGGGYPHPHAVAVLVGGVFDVQPFYGRDVVLQMEKIIPYPRAHSKCTGARRRAHKNPVRRT